jgi:hypothetical protein
LKFGTHGVEAVLRRVRRRARRDRTLRRGQKQDVVDYAEDVLTATTAARTSGAVSYMDPGTIEAAHLSRYLLLRPSLYDDARRAVLSFEALVRDWLEQQGWSVTDAGRPGFPDFIGERDDEIAWIETKVRKSAVGRSLLYDWISRLTRTQHRQAVDRFMLFLSAPRFYHDALEGARDTRAVEIYLETGFGDFELINGTSRMNGER